MTVYRRNPLLMTVMGANPGPRTRKTAEKALDAAISGAWHRLMSGVQVPIMDIPKIFRDIKLEMAAGVPLEQAVTSVGTRYRVNRNPFGEAIVAGVTGALVNRAFQSNGGPSFVLIEKDSGLVVYTKRATGMGNAAITSCAMAGRRLAARTGKTYVVFLDTRGLRRGMTVNVPMVYALGITEEVGPEGISPNPHLEGHQCASCSGSLAYLGTLGNREHYRCRNCGMDTSTPVVRPIRHRHYKKLCIHGTITARCRVCRGRKLEGRTRACIHGFSDASRCLQCLKHQRPGGPVKNNPAIRKSWDSLTGRQRKAILEFAGVDEDLAFHLSRKSWESLGAIDPDSQRKVTLGWRDSSRSPRRAREASELQHETTVRMNPGGTKRKMTMTVQKFAAWVKSKRDPAMWKAFLAKFRGYEKWTHGAKARKVTVEWVDTPGVNGLWITYDGGKQPESTYIMPKGSPRKGAWKHPWDTMPDIKHDPEAKIVITKLRGSSKITDFYHK